MKCKLCGREFNENVSDAVDKHFCCTNCEVLYLGKVPKDPLLIKKEKEEQKREKQAVVFKQKKEKYKEKEEKRKKVQIARVQKKKERHEIAELKKQERQLKKRIRLLNFVSVLQKINLSWLIFVVNYLAILVFRFVVDMRTEAFSVIYIIFYILLYIVPIVLSIIIIKRYDFLDSRKDSGFLDILEDAIFPVGGAFGFSLIVLLILWKIDVLDLSFWCCISIPLTTFHSMFICQKKNKIHFSRNMEVGKKIKSILQILFLLCLEIIFFVILTNVSIREIAFTGFLWVIVIIFILLCFGLA